MKMSDVANSMYKMMVWTYKIQDMFSKPGDVLLRFEIKKGDTVVDYGCGPGRYIKKASELVGEKGKVIAADIHEIAIENVVRRIQRQTLKNVVPVLLGKNNEGVPESIADLVYALDMFHQVKDPVEFLSKIHRIIKENGFLYLEDGHQPREITLNKIAQSELWHVDSESDGYVRLKPLGKLGHRKGKCR